MVKTSSKRKASSEHSTPPDKKLLMVSDYTGPRGDSPTRRHPPQKPPPVIDKSSALDISHIIIPRPSLTT